MDMRQSFPSTIPVDSQNLALVMKGPKEPQTDQRGKSKRTRTLILIAISLALLAFATLQSLSAYSSYSHAQTLAKDGVAHLEKVIAKLPKSSKDLSTWLNAKSLSSVEPDIEAAQSDFSQLSSDLAQAPIFSIAGRFPVVSSDVYVAQKLAHVAIDATHIASLVIDSAQMALSILQRSPLKGNSPFLTTSDLTKFNSMLISMSYLAQDITSQSRGVNFGIILSAAQQAQVDKLLAELPKLSSGITLTQQFIKIAPALLGLNSPVTYLVVTADTSELRADGGFQGNFATATVSQGRLVNKLRLTDTYLLDESNGVCWNSSSVAPSQYTAWWPFGCWGLRDAGLSADFPTSARYMLNLYEAESKSSVQGVVVLTPVIIEQLLSLTGPVYVGDGYNVTVTAANLQSTIHFFQLTYHGPGSDLAPDLGTSARKVFTSLLGNALQARLKQMPQSELLAFAKDAFDDLKTKDIQIYSSNSSVEQFFSSEHLDSAMQRTNDGLFVVDTNLSGKQNSYIQEHIADSIQLDNSGAATHRLTITYRFEDPSGAPTYSYFPSYRDYLRVYVPAGSVFLHSSTSGIQPVASDQPDRAMWAGFVYVAENGSPVTVSLSWHVADAVSVNHSYSFVLQKQAGNHVSISLSIDEAASAKPVLAYNTPQGHSLNTDMMFSIQISKSGHV